MSDARLRTLEREAAATGTLEARAALLRAWGRAGWATPLACAVCSGRGYVTYDNLEPVPKRAMCIGCNGTGRAPYSEALALGAYCGDEACRVLAPCGIESCRGQCCECMESTNLAGWLSGLDRWGVTLRAAVAVGWAAHDAQPDEVCAGLLLDGHICYGPGWCSQLRSLEAAQRYLDDPSEENREAWDDYILDHPNLPDFALLPADTVLGAGVLVNGHPAWLDRLPMCGLTDTQVRDAIRAALVPWALGETV